jgi:hypothetical protein
MTSPPTTGQRLNLRIGVRGLHDAERLDAHPAHPAHDPGSELATALMLAARANAVEARRVRHRDRRAARRATLHSPRTQSAPAHAVLVLVAEGLGGIHG